MCDEGLDGWTNGHGMREFLFMVCRFEMGVLVDLNE